MAKVHDVLVVGAGLSGVYSLLTFRNRFPSWRVKAIEAGSDVGGVWFWNKYPGCRIDTESLSYCYSFDEDLLEEWTWMEHFATQADIHRYIRRVAEKHELYEDITFNARITSAMWDDSDRTWTLIDGNANEYKTRFLVNCLGFLSSPTRPNVPGIEDFAGESFHTSRWPAELDLGRDFANKRIGVIGTGATGIQTITAISKEPSIKSLTVFQRTANWSAPLRNNDFTPDELSAYKGEYDGLFQQCADSPSGFLHVADPRKTMEVREEDRIAFWETLYHKRGFAKWMGVFSDCYTDRQANKLYSDFIANKIRRRVIDPLKAETLIPKNHGFGTRRVPLESGYFEAFNEDHVHLVDLQKTPVEKITATGITTNDGEAHLLDVLIYATGFDAITGAFSAIDWRAKNGRPLISNSQEESADAIWPHQNIRTYLGLTAPGLPNAFMVLGPHQPFGNATRSIEHAVEVVAGILDHCRQNGYTYIDPKDTAVDEWTGHVIDCDKAAILINEVDSWMTGVNKNVEGKMVRSVVRYSGSAQEFRRRCEECRQTGYDAFITA